MTKCNFVFAFMLFVVSCSNGKLEVDRNNRILGLKLHKVDSLSQVEAIYLQDFKYCDTKINECIRNGYVFLHQGKLEDAHRCQDMATAYSNVCASIKTKIDSISDEKDSILTDNTIYNTAP